MATQINITKVDLANVPSGTSTWTFEHKLYSASAYTLDFNNKVVNIDGTLVVPFSITGLTAGQLYYLRVSNNCSSPVESYVQQIQL